MRDELIVESPSNNKTVGEKWKGRVKGHWYDAACEFAVDHLGGGTGECLVIGSPLFEVGVIEMLGYEVTYVDVRDPPTKVPRFLKVDATHLLSPDNSFDAVSSTCVLCHAGLGRYGDKVNLEHGDEKMLSEIERVLKPGGKVSLMFGPVADIPKPLRHGTEHRIYTIHEVIRMISTTGLKRGKIRIWNTEKSDWRPPLEFPTQNTERPDYICVALTNKK